MTFLRCPLLLGRISGTVLGNPDIDTIRHSDTQTATQHRTQRQAHWKQRIQRVIQHVEQDEGLSSGTAIAHALNQRGLTTYEGKPFTSATISRLRREGAHNGA